MTTETESKESNKMSHLQGIRSIVFPTKDEHASVTAFTQLLGKAPALQAPGFVVFNDGANEVILSTAPWVDYPLVFWQVDDIEKAHRALVASGAKAMGEIAGGSVAELGTAPVTNGDPTTGIVDVPSGRRIAALQIADGTIIAILQEPASRG